MFSLASATAVYQPRGDGPGEATPSSPKIVVLHLPRSGGSAVCEAVKHATNLTTPATSNCWEDGDGPEWCCLHHARMVERSCESRRQSNFSFAMVERYMDSGPSDKAPRTLFCPGITYGLLLQEPVHRAFSHVQLFASWNRGVDSLLSTLPSSSFAALVEALDRTPLLSNASRAVLLPSYRDYLAHFSERPYYKKTSAPPGDSAAAAVATPVAQRKYLLRLEPELRKVNAFTSNYLARMLLGAQLGPEPLAVPASVLAGGTASTAAAQLYARAAAALSQFDFVLFTARLSAVAAPAATPRAAAEATPAAGRLPRQAAGLLPPEVAAWLRSNNAPLRRQPLRAGRKDEKSKLLESGLQSWLRQRNQLDAALYDAAWRKSEHGRRDEPNG